MTRDQILTRLGELVGEIQSARSAEDIPTLSSLTEERDHLREVLRSHAPLSVDDMRRELEGLRTHLSRFQQPGTLGVALGEDSAAGTVSAVGAVASQQASADPHSAVAWMRQRIAFLEEQLADT
ncbi:MAG: hypothetical protein HKN46_09935 [Acidimicrobiia bacterium]|nr:hypothetical protein [Acidimicrobiia bacterium]